MKVIFLCIYPVLLCDTITSIFRDTQSQHSIQRSMAMCCLSKMYVLNWVFFKYSKWEGIVCHQEKILSQFFKTAGMPISIEISCTWPHLCPHASNYFSLCSRVHYFAMFLLSDSSYNSAGTTQCSVNVSKDSCHML